MALEAVVFQQDLFNHSGKDLYNLFGGNWSYNDFGLEREEDYNKAAFEILENQTEKGHYGNWNASPPPSMVPHLNEWCHHPISSSEADIASGSSIHGELPPLGTSTTTSVRPKRRRSKSRKNKEEIEYQRMTHIAVERNRRKQMNDYLSVLRSLMPDSYVQRGDQASIIGGAINFVKELEQRLQLLGGHKQAKGKSDGGGCGSPSSPFSEFFTFPQYSTSSARCDSTIPMTEPSANINQPVAAIADIEVTMVESHANLKIRSRRRPKQLLKMVSGLQILRLTILHLNVTTVDQIVLYSLSVKVEDDCKLTSVDEIATAVYQILDRIQEEAGLN
ncbi:hypothetical protein L1049_020819 [Liquidambar formosana]|uniref:BHLH domain-containing protein n=1 Tax=Liquidambar formosana TaxID=63359 RepID=A0AAP0X4L9_LIQFO